MLAMVMTFFKKRMTIQPVSEACYGSWDCIVLAGPTWSYHPSGPMLDFLDRFAQEVCGGTIVIPFISCRSYWQLNFSTLKKRLTVCGCKVWKPIVFMHPQKEPWRVIGLILQLRGKMMRRENSWFRKHYPGYGHSKEQGNAAFVAGKELAEQLLKE